MQEPKLLTVKQIGELYGLKRDFIYRAIKRGDLPRVSFGTHATRIPRAALDQFIAARTGPVDPERSRKLALHARGIKTKDSSDA